MFESGPRLSIHLGIEAAVRQARKLAQQGIELRLDRADRDEVTASTLIDAVKVRAAVQKIALAPFGPAAHRSHVEEHRHQRGGAVAHRGIHHLPLAGFLCLQQRGEHADHEIECAAAKISDQVERRHRLLFRTDRGQRAGHRDVIDIVTGGLRERALLAPSGHAAINQTRIVRLHHFRPEPQPFHDARAEAFDQRVGMAQQIQYLCDASLVL